MKKLIVGVLLSFFIGACFSVIVNGDEYSCAVPSSAPSGGGGGGITPSGTLTAGKIPYADAATTVANSNLKFYPTNTGGQASFFGFTGPEIDFLANDGTSATCFLTQDGNSIHAGCGNNWIFDQRILASTGITATGGTVEGDLGVSGVHAWQVENGEGRFVPVGGARWIGSATQPFGGAVVASTPTYAATSLGEQQATGKTFGPLASFTSSDSTDGGVQLGSYKINRFATDSRMPAILFGPDHSGSHVVVYAGELGGLNVIGGATQAIAAHGSVLAFDTYDANYKIGMYPGTNSDSFIYSNRPYDIKNALGTIVEHIPATDVAPSFPLGLAVNGVALNAADGLYSNKYFQVGGTAAGIQGQGNLLFLLSGNGVVEVSNGTLYAQDPIISLTGGSANFGAAGAAPATFYSGTSVFKVDGSTGQATYTVGGTRVATVRSDSGALGAGYLSLAPDADLSAATSLTPNAGRGNIPDGDAVWWRAANGTTASLVMRHPYLSLTTSGSYGYSNTNAVFNNTGSSGSLNLTLQAGNAIGTEFIVITSTANNIVLLPDTGVTIYDGTSTCSSVTLAGLGSRVTTLIFATDKVSLSAKAGSVTCTP